MVVARLMFALDQWILYVGLLLIAVGFLMTTSYR
jgi:positive regulator of sigma E activity